MMNTKYRIKRIEKFNGEVRFYVEERITCIDADPAWFEIPGSHPTVESARERVNALDGNRIKSETIVS